jgi:hypothetical protein
VSFAPGEVRSRVVISPLIKCRHPRSTRSPDGKLRVVVGSTQRSARTRRSPDLRSKSMELGEVSAASPGVSAQEEAAAKAKWRRKQTWNIIAFSLPALSIVLVDPLMTLLDTVLIGQVPLPATLLNQPTQSDHCFIRYPDMSRCIH